MTGTALANVTALLPGRRSFLRQLTTLPLIGGGLTLIGKPQAVAEPVTYDMLQAYKTWLHYEHRILSHEIADHPRTVGFYGGKHNDRYRLVEPLISFVNVGDADRFHFPNKGEALPPSTRAALVMSAVGCDWREPDETRL